MARKASVTLDLDAAKYLREAASVSVATKAVDEEMKGLGRASDAAGRDMDQLAVQAELAKKGLGGVGTEARDTRTDLTALQARIEATKAGIKDMNAEWARTGDDKIRAQIRKETSLLRDLERAAKDVAGATTKAVDAEVHLGDATAAVSHDVDRLAGETKVAGGAVNKFAVEAARADAALKALDARIQATQASIRDLGIEFATSGDAGAGKSLTSERGALGQMTKLRKEIAAAHEELTKLNQADILSGDGKRGNLLTRLLGTAQDAVATGVRVGGAVVQGFGSAFSAMPPIIKPILIGALVAAVVIAAPMMAAMIGGAVALGVGAIGIAGGIFAATHDPAVQAAIMDFQGSISTMFFNSAGSFVGPLVNALGILKTGFRDLDLKSTFALAAPYVTVLAQGLADMGREFMPRFRDALRAAGPALTMMAQQLPRVGAALGDMLQSMAESKGTVQGVEALFGLISMAARNLGVSIAWISDRFYEMNQVIALTTGHLANLIDRGNPVGAMFGWMHDTAQKFVEQSKNIPPAQAAAAAALEVTRVQMQATGDATSELVGKTKNLYDTTMSLARANLDLKQKMADLKQSFEDNGKTLDVNTQKGRDNWRATLDSVDAAKAKYDADVALGQNMETARLIYEGNIKKIQEQAAAAHASADQVQTLTDKLNQVPHLTLAELRLQFEQSGTLLGEHSGLRKNELNPPATPKPLARNTGRGNRWGGAYTHAADGALRQADVYSAQSPARYAFAEPATGGEAFVPKYGDYARSMDILQTAAGWYGARIAPKWEAAQPPGSWQSAGGMGGGTTRFELVVSTAPGADQRVMAAITEGLRFDIDTKSAGDVQAHLTRRR